MFTLKSDGIQVSNHNNLTDGDLLNLACSLSSLDGDIKSKLLHWDFGPIMEMKYSQAAENYLFSNEAVPFHWDGAFYKEPRYLLFYCLESNGDGGETIFTNTEMIWNSLSEEDKRIASTIKLKYTTDKKAHYGGEINIPLVQSHPINGKTILRMAEKVETNLNPVHLEIMSTKDIDKINFYNEFVQKLYDKDFVYEHEWKKGDLVIVDNFTFLHGRNPLKNNLTRSFKRIQIL